MFDDMGEGGEDMDAVKLEQNTERPDIDAIEAYCARHKTSGIPETARLAYAPEYLAGPQDLTFTDVSTLCRYVRRLEAQLHNRAEAAKAGVEGVCAERPDLDAIEAYCAKVEVDGKSQWWNDYFRTDLPALFRYVRRLETQLDDWRNHILPLAKADRDELQRRLDLLAEELRLLRELEHLAREYSGDPVLQLQLGALDALRKERDGLRD